MPYSSMLYIQYLQVEQLVQAKADTTFRLTVIRKCKLEGPAAPAWTWKLHTDSEDWGSEQHEIQNIIFTILQNNAQPSSTLVKQQQHMTILCTIRWIEKQKVEWIFSPQFSSTFAHFSYKLPRWVLFCPDGVSFCREYHHQPLFFTQQSQTTSGDMYIHKDTPNPTPKHPFSWPEVESGQNECYYCLGKMDPNWAKCLKSGQKLF